jgi:hypothetical protein
MIDALVRPERRTRAARAHEDDCTCRTCNHRRHTVLVRDVVRYLNEQPDVVAWEMQPAGEPTASGRPQLTGPRGMADVCGILAPCGRWIALECKTGQAYQSPAQRVWQRLVEAHGGMYRVVRCLEDVAQAVQDARSEARR